MLTDEKKHLVCQKCHHPLFSEVAGINGGKDAEGEYVRCLICGHKNYINKTTKES